MLDMMDDDQDSMYKNFWIGIAILYLPIFLATVCILCPFFEIRWDFERIERHMA